MRKLVLVFALSLFALQLSAQEGNEHFFVVTGKPSDASRGDNAHRTVFQISFKDATAPLYLRVFDADAGGAHDEIATPTTISYALYSSLSLTKIFTIEDNIAASPIEELSLGADNRYDNQWKTLFTIDPSKHASKTLYLVVDGLEGKGSNLYRLAISTNEFFNQGESIASIRTNNTALRPITSKSLSTQLYFTVPSNAASLNVNLHDSENVNDIYFETDERRFIKVKHSTDGANASTKITLKKEELGKRAAIIIANNRVKKENFQLWLTDNSGAPILFDATFADARINNLPKPKLLLHPTDNCTELILDGSRSTDADGDRFAIEWHLPNGVVKQGLTTSHNFGAAGTFDVVMKLKDNSGLVAHTKTFKTTVVVNAPPVAAISMPEKVVPNTPVVLDASQSTDSDGKIVDYIWEIAGAGTFRGKKITHTFEHAGTYPIKLTVKDNGKLACQTAEKIATIWVNAEPVPRLSAPEKGAIGETLSFDASASSDSDGKITAYNWRFSDGTEKRGALVSHAFKSAGMHSATVEVVDESGLSNSSKSLKKSFKINAAPVPSFSYKTPVSTLDNNRFSAAKSSDSDGKIIAYEWSFGDGQTASGLNATHTYSAPGTYSVQLTITDDSGTKSQTASLTQQIRVNKPPVPVFSAAAVITTSQASFDASASADSDDPIISYAWNFGDGKKGSGKNPTHIYTQSGTYTVNLAVTDGSKTRTNRVETQKTIRVNAPPVAAAGADIITAPNKQITLDASASTDSDGSINSYTWQLSDGTSKTGKSISHSFKKSGTFFAKLTVRDNDGTERSDQARIVVNAAPTARIAPLKRIAPNEVLALDASPSFDTDGKITAVRWFFNNEDKSKRGYRTSKKFATSGVYPVRVEITDNSSAPNETSVLNTSIEVNHAPEPNAGQDVATDKLLVSFSAAKSSDADNSELHYSWDFGDGNTATGRDVAHLYKSAGSFPVTLTVNDGEGLANSVQRDAIRVNINHTPVAKISAASVACAGDQVLFDATTSSDADADLLKYEWDFGDGQTAVGASPVYQFKSSGYFKVTLKVTDNSGLANATATASHLVYVSSAPVANAGAAQTVCANTVVSFDGSASSGGDKALTSYEWDFGDGSLGGGMKPTHVFTKEGTYQVRLTVGVAENGDCSTTSSDIVEITVLPAPQAVFSIVSEAAENEQITVDGSKSSAGSMEISDYIWDFGDGTLARGKTANHTYKTAGAYTVKLTVKTNTTAGCNTSEFVQQIRINKAPTAEITASTKTPTAFDYIQLSAAKSADTDGHIKSYKWQLDGKDVSSNIEFRHQFKAAGTYTVRLTVADASKAKNNTHSTETVITVSPRTEFTLSGPAELCLGKSGTFTASTQGVWKVDGKTTNAVSVDAVFSTAGVHTLSFTSGAVTKTHSVRVFKPETPTLRVSEAKLDVNTPFTADIDQATLADYTISWRVNDVPVSKKQAFAHTFKSAGSYTVSAELSPKSGMCATISLSEKITVYSAPSLQINVDETTLFAGGFFDETRFSAHVTSDFANPIYRWSFGDGKTAFGKDATHAYAKSGSFTVTLTVQDGSVANPKSYSVSKKITVARRK